MRPMENFLARDKFTRLPYFPFTRDSIALSWVRVKRETMLNANGADIMRSSSLIRV